MTTTTKLKNSPEEKPFKITREERFWRLYLAAFGNLHARFGKDAYPDSEAAEFRSKDFAQIAWNSATEACKLFAEEKTIENFNKRISHVK